MGLTLKLNIMVILCLFSCQLIGQEKVTDAFVSYDLNTNHRKIKLTDLIEEVEFIRLEETSSSLLGSFGDIHLVGDKIVFVGDRYKGDIYVFSKDGEFINRINRSGLGPEEYPSIQSMWMEEDLIAVYTYQKGIKRYKLNGDFVNSSKLNMPAVHVLRGAENYFLDMNFNALADQSKYKLVRLNEKMDVTGKYLPFQKATAGGMSTYSSLFNYKGSVGFYRPNSDTVYLYQQNKFLPFIHFEFGNNWHWDDYDPFGSNIIQGLREGEKVWSIKPKIGPRYAITSSLYGKSGRSRLEHLIDRSNGQIILIDLKRTSKKGSFDLDISHWESEDTFYAVLPSLDAVGLITEASSRNWTFRGGTSLEEITSSENPVLVRIRIKDFAKN